MSSYNDKMKLCDLLWLGLVVIGSLLLAACDTNSSTSGIEGTGITESLAGCNPSSSPCGGTPGPLVSVSSGRIESTDGVNVKVNGVSWSATDAKVSIDGVPGSARDLKPGMIAAVSGTLISATLGTATAIDTQIAVRGPIVSIDVPSAHLSVMGQRVVADQHTVLDIPGETLESLYVGQTVEVSGFLVADTVYATRISIPTPSAVLLYAVTGPVTSVDGPARALTINGLAVSFRGALLVGFESSYFPAVGQVVTVTGRTFADSGALIADSIHRYDALPAIANAEVVVSGSIWRIYSDFDFYVGYQRVLALPDAAVPDGELVRGSRVRVMGTLSADGVVHASEVVVLSSPSEKQVFEIGGIVDAVNVGSLGSRTMTLLGVEIGFNSGTLTVDMPSFNPSSPDAVAVGNFVYAQVFEDGSAGYMARQEGLNGRIGSVISGAYFKSVSPPQGFTLSGFADFDVLVTPSTRFLHGDLNEFNYCYCIDVSAEDFWQQAVIPRPAGAHSYVRVTAEFTGSMFVALQVWVHTGEAYGLDHAAIR